MGEVVGFETDDASGTAADGLDASAVQVEITFDGDALPARQGMPLAAALVGAGKLAIARSPKFHRPRGPACMRGACDGCLVRVDGEPNVLSCMTPVRAGMVVESQNTLGTRNVDLLRMTDWFFPEGLNHHELFAGVPGVQNIMQVFARRVAGLGRMPKDAKDARPAKRRAVDVLVVGGGPSGLAIGALLARAGRTVELVDDGVTLGGSLRSLAKSDEKSFAPIVDAVRTTREKRALRVSARTTAGGVFGDDVLVVGPTGAEVLVAKTLVLAPGAHDGVLAFEGNDVPGVMSARALGQLLRLDVTPGKKICIVRADDAPGFGDSAARAAAERGLEVEVVTGTPVKAAGASRVKAIVIASARGKEKEIRADIVAIDAPSAPAYELCEQAGAKLVHEPRGYVVKTERGRIRDGVFAVGEVCGTPFDAARIQAEAERVAKSIASP